MILRMQSLLTTVSDETKQNKTKQTVSCTFSLMFLNIFILRSFTGWYKVSKAVTDRCLSELGDELESNLPLLDFSKFSVNIERLGGEHWDSENIVCDNIGSDAMRNKVLDGRRRLNAVVEITYS